MFLLYNLLVTIAALIWVPAMLLKASSRSVKPNWQQRMGNYSIARDKTKRRLWIHTVSVGEFLAATPILRGLRERLPDHEIVVSVPTPSGHTTAEGEQEKADGRLYDHLVYFPLEVPRFCLSAMQKVQPEVVAVMETELWMDFLWAAKTFEARTVLVNGRISDRSFPRARRLTFFYKSLLGYLDKAYMQTEADAERIRELGAHDTSVLGNCKFDQALPSEAIDTDALKQDLKLESGLPVVVIGSTRGEEEEPFVLEALKGVGPVQVVHAPRHLERVPLLQEAAEKAGFQVGLRSAGASARYLILDTYGELANVYAIADVVIVGGGFANLGGQNILQPLAHGKPVIHGPHMQNFKDVARNADESGAAIAVATPSELCEAIRALLADPKRRESMGDAAKKLIESNVGASARYVEAIADQVGLYQAAKERRRK